MEESEKGKGAAKKKRKERKEGALGRAHGRLRKGKRAAEAEKQVGENEEKVRLSVHF